MLTVAKKKKQCRLSKEYKETKKERKKAQKGDSAYWACDGRTRKKICNLRGWRDPDVLVAVQAAIGMEDLDRRVKREMSRINLFEDHAEIILKNGKKTIWCKNSKGHSGDHQPEDAGADQLHG